MVTPHATKDEVCEMLKCNGTGCKSSLCCHSTYQYISKIMFTYRENGKGWGTTVEAQKYVKNPHTILSKKRWKKNWLTSGFPWMFFLNFKDLGVTWEFIRSSDKQYCFIYQFLLYINISTSLIEERTREKKEVKIIPPICFNSFYFTN